MIIIEIREESERKEMLRNYKTMCRTFNETTNEVDQRIAGYAEVTCMLPKEALEDVLSIANDIDADRYLHANK